MPVILHLSKHCSICSIINLIFRSGPKKVGFRDSWDGKFLENGEYRERNQNLGLLNNFLFFSKKGMGLIVLV